MARRHTASVARHLVSRRMALALMVGGALAACGSAGSGGDGHVDESVPVVLGAPGPGDAAHHQPLEVGNAWQYQGTVTEDGALRDFRVTIRSVERRQVAGGATATVFLETFRGVPVAEQLLVGDANGVAEFAGGDVAGLGGAVGPYWLLRFPLDPGETFVQLDTGRLDLGQDLNRDGLSESFSERSIVTVLGREDVTVPAGTFADCAKVQTTADATVFSGGGYERASARVAATVWWAPGVGWVRRIEDVLVDGAPVASNRFELDGYSVNGRVAGTLWWGPAPDRVELDGSYVNLTVGDTARVTATVWSGATRLDGAPVAWRTDDPAIATVSVDGVVTGVAPGSTWVRATVDGTESGRKPVAVVAGRRLALATNDMVYDRTRGRLYASVPGRQRSSVANSVVSIDPASGEVVATLANVDWFSRAPLPTGEPSVLALSGDDRFLYVALDRPALDGLTKVARLDLAAAGGPVIDLTFGIGPRDPSYGPLYVEDMEVMPGAPDTVAISRRYAPGYGRHAGVAVFDGGVQRQNATAGYEGTSLAIEFSDDPSRLYARSAELIGGRMSVGFGRLTIDAAGVTRGTPVEGLVTESRADLEYAAGVAYATTGAAIDAEAATLAGTFPGVSYAAGSLANGPVMVEPDPAHGRVFFLRQQERGVLAWELRAYDAASFALVSSSVVAPSGIGTPADLIRWGPRGLAYRTAPDSVLREEYNHIVFLDDAPGLP